MFSALVKIIMIDLFFAHIIACLFWMVGSNSLSTNYKSWILKNGLNDADTGT